MNNKERNQKVLEVAKKLIKMERATRYDLWDKVWRDVDKFQTKINYSPKYNCLKIRMDNHNLWSDFHADKYQREIYIIAPLTEDFEVDKKKLKIWVDGGK